jgi:hypothetical protein
VHITGFCEQLALNSLVNEMSDAEKKSFVHTILKHNARMVGVAILNFDSILYFEKKKSFNDNF